MALEQGQSPLERHKRVLDQARAALSDPHAGAIGSLECRVADLQNTFLDTPARTLGDLEIRLRAIRDVVHELGAQGYLAHLVEAALADVQTLREQAKEGVSGR